MFTPLGLNHTNNARVATNHLLDIPQRQTTHFGTYSITLIHYQPGITFKETSLKTS